MAGNSRLMGADEEGTLERFEALRRELVDPKIAEHKGSIVKTNGGGLLVEFAIVVDAVRCAVGVQQVISERTNGVAADTAALLFANSNMSGDAEQEQTNLGPLKGSAAGVAS